MISDRCCDPLHMNVFLWIVASQLASCGRGVGRLTSVSYSQ